MDVRGFLGGHPIAVFMRLALICLLVGLVLSLFGITPRNFFQTIDDLDKVSGIGPSKMNDVRAMITVK